MGHSFLIVCALFLVGCHDRSESGRDRTFKGKLACEHRSKKIDSSNEKMEVVFTLRNIDTVPLKIYKIASSCACTTPDQLDGKVVEAKEEIVFSVKYNGPSKPGVHQEVLIYNSGGENPYMLSVYM